MNHDDDVGAGCKREPVTSLLISAVAAIFRMHLHLHVLERARDLHRFIIARVVHHYDKIDNPLLHDFVVGPFQRARGVVGRHHHDDFLAA